jgi:Concanavalin A-like lectin/glucanases superfamily
MGMQIYVQKLSDPLAEWPLDVESSDTVLGVVSKVIDAELPNQYSAQYIKLFFNSIELNPSFTLSDYNIQKNSHLTSTYTPITPRAAKKHTLLGRTVEGKDIFLITIFNNTFNSTVNAQNTTWRLGPYQEIVTSPPGCPNAQCLHFSQATQTSEDSPPSLYSNQGFGKKGMLDLTKSFTIECWFYVTNIDENANHFGDMGAFSLLRSDGGDPFFITFLGNRSIKVGINTDTHPYTTYETSEAVFNLNSWNHIAVTSNQSLGKTTTYINGINRAEANYTTNTNGNGDNWGSIPNAAWEWGKTHGNDENGYDIYISNMRWSQIALYTTNFIPSFVNFPNSAN